MQRDEYDATDGFRREIVGGVRSCIARRPQRLSFLIYLCFTSQSKGLPASLCV